MENSNFGFNYQYTSIQNSFFFFSWKGDQQSQLPGQFLGCVCVCVCRTFYATLDLVCLVTQLYLNPWTVAFQALLCMGFSLQEHWSGLPFPPSGGSPGQAETTGD